MIGIFGSGFAASVVSYELSLRKIPNQIFDISDTCSKIFKSEFNNCDIQKNGNQFEKTKRLFGGLDVWGGGAKSPFEELSFF